MATFQEHQNLPSLHDVPVIEDRNLMEFLITMKELIEEMLGRRENVQAPAIPQFEMGTYMGDGVEGRLIPVRFRPRYVRVYLRPEGTYDERIYTKLDDPCQDIDWGPYSIRENTTDHDWLSAAGIIDITDEGFTVDGGNSHPNIAESNYDWVAFG